MSYQRLVMCVDTSGSMSGDRIKNARTSLNQIANALNVPTAYYKFDTSITPLTEYSESTLQAGGGTRIESCLMSLFKTHLRAYKGSKTKFVFVTDACDSIRDVEGVISAKRECEAAYGNNKLHCHLSLTGSGGCAAELQQIFGARSFDHTKSNAEFQANLQGIAVGVKKAQQVSKASAGIQKQTESLKKENAADMKQFEDQCKDIQKELNQIEDQTKAAQQEIDTVAGNISNLKTQTTELQSQVDGARTHQQIDRVEEAVYAKQSEWMQESNRLEKAGEKLDKAKEGLQRETSRADVIAKKLEETGSKLSKKAQTVITNIMANIKKLNEITSGSYDQVKDLKQQFTKDLDNLMKVVQSTKKSQNELQTLKKSIRSAFKDLNRGHTEWNGFKQEIENNMDRLNQMLEILDSRE